MNMNEHVLLDDHLCLESDTVTDKLAGSAIPRAQCPEESLALPPEFDSFCVRHSPANEQVVNEEFPGANAGAVPIKTSDKSNLSFLVMWFNQE